MHSSLKTLDSSCLKCFISILYKDLLLIKFRQIFGCKGQLLLRKKQPQRCSGDLIKSISNTKLKSSKTKLILTTSLGMHQLGDTTGHLWVVV